MKKYLILQGEENEIESTISKLKENQNLEMKEFDEFEYLSDYENYDSWCSVLSNFTEVDDAFEASLKNTLEKVATDPFKVTQERIAFDRMVENPKININEDQLDDIFRFKYGKYYDNIYRY